MNNVNGVNPLWAPKPIEPTNAVVPNASAGAPEGISDVVEITTASALAAKVHQVPEVRADLVARVKNEIEAGTYETPERLDAAVEKLLEDVVPELL